MYSFTQTQARRVKKHTHRTVVSGKTRWSKVEEARRTVPEEWEKYALAFMRVSFSIGNLRKQIMCIYIHIYVSNVMYILVFIIYMYVNVRMMRTRGNNRKKTHTHTHTHFKYLCVHNLGNGRSFKNWRESVSSHTEKKLAYTHTHNTTQLRQVKTLIYYILTSSLPVVIFFITVVVGSIHVAYIYTYNFALSLPACVYNTYQSI